MELIIGGWLLCGIIAGVIRQNKGRGLFAGLLIGALLGPIGIIIALAEKPRDAVEEQLQSGALRACPFCAEPIRAEAIVCRYCGRDVELAGDEEPAADPEPTYFSCPQCGQKVSSGMDFCVHCGAKLPA